MTLFSQLALAEPLTQPRSPSIQAGTLFIEGPIGSHIYDYLSYERERLKDVQWVSLNSFGGDHDWSLEIARVIREQGLSTRLEPGAICASACLYLFASGRERIMSQDNWLGFHGARLNRKLIPTFWGLCGENPEMKTASESCRTFVAEWTVVTETATHEALATLESFGISPDLRREYLSLPDDPDWLKRFNFFKKPDLVITAEVALRLQFATGIATDPPASPFQSH